MLAVDHHSLTSHRLLHAAGVPFVAGWRSIVADAAAPFFTRGFLVALQRGADYARAFEQGTLGVTTPTEGPDPSLRALRTPTNNLVGTATTQRFELVDPKSPSVVQPSEVNAPHWTPPRHGPLRAKWRGRVRQGQPGEGRFAAGAPDHSEHAPPPPFGVPLLPPTHLPRPDAVAAVLEHLCVPRPQSHQGVLVAASVLGVHGMGGIGKTVLCQLVCQHSRVRYRFPDGILWLTVSEEPDIVLLQGRLRDHLRNYVAGARALRHPSEGRDELRQLLQGKACLIVLDDVWTRQHHDELIGGCVAGFSQILISTRNADQFNSSTPVVSLNQLDDPNARALLLLTAGLDQTSLPPDIESAVMALVKRGCGLPLALSILGAMVEGDVEQLRRLATTTTELRLSSEQLNMPYAHRSVMECIEMSFAALPDDVTRQQLLDLALYPEDAVVPLEALALRWCRDLDFASEAAADAVRRALRLLRKRAFDLPPCAPRAAAAARRGRPAARRRRRAVRVQCDQLICALIAARSADAEQDERASLWCRDSRALVVAAQDLDAVGVRGEGVLPAARVCEADRLARAVCATSIATQGQQVKALLCKPGGGRRGQKAD